MKTHTLAAAAAALLALALGACSAGGQSSSDSASTTGGMAAEMPAGDTAGQAESGSDAAADSAAAPVPAAAPGTVTPIDQAEIVSTGTVSLRADDVRGARNEVQRITDKYAGHVGDEDASTDDDGKVSYARLVLRIPSASYDDARQELEGVAELVESTTKSEDVTTQVRDTDERVKAMRASLERMRTLLGAATKISDILRIESEITSREADLNSLLSQQAYLTDQTSLSTITVDISREAIAHVTKHERRTGFLAGLSSGWDGLTSFATGVATVAGLLLPWLPVALLIGIPGWLLIRRARRSARTPSAA